ncbi:Uncharacterised protein [Enterobacter hormaechei]|nr:Uncharacterised protein [Enterobacter hormaechei]
MNAGMSAGGREGQLFPENGISYGMGFRHEMLKGASFSKTYATVA